jgi:hypothetical protein
VTEKNLRSTETMAKLAVTLVGATGMMLCPSALGLAIARKAGLGEAGQLLAAAFVPVALLATMRLRYGKRPDAAKGRHQPPLAMTAAVAALPTLVALLCAWGLGYDLAGQLCLAGLAVAHAYIVMLGFANL